MLTFISLLRGINVSGQKRIIMTDLKTIYTSLDLRDVTTYIQSGNVIFRTAITDAMKISNLLERALLNHFGYPVTVLVRKKTEFKKIIEGNPYLGKKDVDVSNLHVTFLTQEPSDIIIEEVGRGSYGSDQFVACGREIYVYCPGGYGKTKLNNGFFEKKLCVGATTRNWNTVNTLFNLADNID